MVLSGRLRSPGAKLGAYAVVLALVLGAGAAVGSAFGPKPSDEDLEPAAHDGGHADAAPEEPATTHPAGLAISQDGYTLKLHTTVVEAARPAELELVIEGPDGLPLTDYEVEHEKELHLVIVGRDLVDYAHVHPQRDERGTWTVTTPPLQPGSHRVYADFVPAGADGLTLAADLDVPGTRSATEPRQPSGGANVEGFDVQFEGELVAGTESELTLTVSRDGQPVTDLEPYLGALGHLVAIREGDLAYLHVHPLDETEGAGGPKVHFAVEVPTDGSYALFFDFSHSGVVRTASVVATANAGG
jgi:hypothetical protein